MNLAVLFNEETYLMAVLFKYNLKPIFKWQNAINDFQVFNILIALGRAHTHTQ